LVWVPTKGMASCDNLRRGACGLRTAGTLIAPEGAGTRGMETS